MANSRVPNQILELRGTRRKDRHGDKSGDLVVIAPLPDPPVWIGTAGLNEWERVVPILQSHGIVQGTDYAALCSYCYLFGRLSVDPDSFTATLYAQLRNLSNDLGLTPLGRSKLPGNRGKKKNEFGDF